jgi:putative acyl-CoA dehydrogenase
MRAMNNARSDLPTHAVTNQPPVRGTRDLWASDPVLRAHAIGADRAALATYGAALGTEETQAAASEAERVGPDLRAFDRGGRRLDEVAFPAGYHHMMRLGLGAGYAATPWTGGSHVTHAAMVYLHSQVEPGTCCPMTMSYAAVPLIRAAPDLADWAAKLTVADYDPAVLPIAQKRAVTLGMAMTEKQGGSDLRSNTTQARPGDGGWRLTGHKWFCSAPMSDGFLTLAQAPGGLTCFLVPRWLEGDRNAIHLVRLKDKLGNRANASTEIEYHDAFALQLGETGRGVATILDMVHHTRLDTALAPAGLMRGALTEAHHWVRHRTAFQCRLIDQPLMQAVLSDLTLDWEGATALGLRVARAFDGGSDADRAFARIAVALAKFLNNKLCPGLIYEAMEVLGGAGYVAESGLPMFYREAPLNSIWEGSGNVICLDILRTLVRTPLAGEVLDNELQAATGQLRSYDAALEAHRSRWPTLPPEAEARWFAESLARLLSAAVLQDQAPDAIAAAYADTRLSGQRGQVAGSIAAMDTRAVLDRLG